jgi:hypothetical protein
VKALIVGRSDTEEKRWFETENEAGKRGDQLGTAFLRAWLVSGNSDCS